jgi:hypothetical protein
MPIRYTDEQIRGHAAHLGLIEAGQSLPQHLRSRVVASLVEQDRQGADRQEPDEGSAPAPARSIDIHPGGAIAIDGRALPWLVAPEPIAITLLPDGSGTVRLSLTADAIRVHPRPHEETAHDQQDP